jgi:hypothetical protein
MSEMCDDDAARLCELRTAMQALQLVLQHHTASRAAGSSSSSSTPLSGILQQPLPLLQCLAAVLLLLPRTGHMAASTATLSLQAMLLLLDLHTSLHVEKTAAQAPAGAAHFSRASTSSGGGRVYSAEEARELLNPTAKLPDVLRFDKAAVAAAEQLLPLLLHSVVPAAADMLQQGQVGEGWGAAVSAVERQQHLAALRASLGSAVMLTTLAGAQVWW